MSTDLLPVFGGGVASLPKRPTVLKATADGPLRCIRVTRLGMGQRESCCSTQ
jgi:hypothetical protein